LRKAVRLLGLAIGLAGCVMWSLALIVILVYGGFVAVEPDPLILLLEIGLTVLGVLLLCLMVIEDDILRV